MEYTRHAPGVYEIYVPAEIPQIKSNVIYSLGADTYTHAHTQIPTSQTSNFKKPGIDLVIGTTLIDQKANYTIIKFS